MSENARSFEACGLFRGTLQIPANAVEIVKNAPVIDISGGKYSGLTSPGYITAQFDDREEEGYRAVSEFRENVGPLADLLTDCVAQLKEPVAVCLSMPWRILNVRTWMTPPAAPAVGMCEFHTDGMPQSIFKIMLYFTPMDLEHGGLEIKEGLIGGPAGSWILFFNSHKEHRGCPGTTKWRAATEFTLARARDFDLELHQPGLNAQWPEYP
jgi:hypothetical protein